MSTPYWRDMWGPPGLASLRLSRPMKRVLLRLRAAEAEGVHDRSFLGDKENVLRALRDRRLFDHGGLTEFGRAIAGRIAEREAKHPTLPAPAAPKSRDLPGQLNFLEPRERSRAR